MRLRSLLFVPGDRPDRIAKAQRLPADALILDLEDAVAPAAKPAARRAVTEVLDGSRSGPALLVRVNPIGSGLIEADLAALATSPPHALVLPKAEGAASIRLLDVLLDAAGLAHLPVLPIATETPAAVFALGSFREVSERLCGLTWGAEDLPAAIGASSSREADGTLTPPYQTVRTLALLAAHAAGVPAIETVHPALDDADGLTLTAATARRDGFSGMLAVHPRQLDAINAAFTPSPEELRRARAIVAAFAASPGTGVLVVDGRMVDTPHLKQAVALLARAGEGIG